MLDKEDINVWLARIGKNRKWLAGKCLVSVGQCYNWFSKSGKIPAAKLALIASLMEESAEGGGPDQVITLVFTEKEMKVVNQFRAAFPDIDLAEYARGKVFELCSSMVESACEFESDALVAEEPGVYAAGLRGARPGETRAGMNERLAGMTTREITDDMLGSLPFKRSAGGVIQGKARPRPGEQAE